MVKNDGNLKGKKKERKEGEKNEREEQAEWKELWWENEQVWKEKFEKKKRLESRGLGNWPGSTGVRSSLLRSLNLSKTVENSRKNDKMSENGRF